MAVDLAPSDRVPAASTGMIVRIAIIVLVALLSALGFRVLADSPETAAVPAAAPPPAATPTNTTAPDTDKPLDS